jgi:hypothetical protein
VYLVVSRVLAAGVACALVGVLGAGTLGLSTALPTDGLDLREGAAGRVEIAVPEPGAVATFHVTARPLTDRPTGLALVVEDGTAPGSSRTGASGVVLTLTDDTGAVLAAGTAAELRGAVVDLGVTDDAPVTVHGEARLRADRPDDGPAPDGRVVALDVRVARAGEGPAVGRSDVRVGGSPAPAGAGPAPGATARREA